MNLSNDFPDIGVIDYMANAIYQGECAQKNTIGCRWTCLREDLRRKYLKKAREGYLAWVADELRAETKP